MSTPPPRIHRLSRYDRDTAELIGQCISEDVEAFDVRPQSGPLRSTIEVPREHTEVYVTRKEDCDCDVHFRVVVFQVREVPERATLLIESDLPSPRESNAPEWDPGADNEALLRAAADIDESEIPY